MTILMTTIIEIVLTNIKVKGTTFGYTTEQKLNLKHIDIFLCDQSHIVIDEIKHYEPMQTYACLNLIQMDLEL